jgi:glucose/arabinose dehydrogenase/PKD repeat protein
MKASRLPWVVVLIGILSMSVVAPVIDVADAAVPSGFTDTLVAGGLNLPTAMEFSPDGRIFVSEKGGNVRVVKNGALLPTPFVSVPVNSQGERGLMGIAFDPNFTTNRYVYIYYTTASDPIHNRVSRFTADPANPDRALPGSEVQILNLETLATESHIGGALEFGKDGKLYVSTGDNYFPYHAQSLSSRFGKILRINPDGTIPTDNPFYNVEGAYREIWALGLRNPFTFAFNPSPSSSLMYINDVGQNSQEEINRGLRGANYGWPQCEGSCSDPRYVDPLYTYPTGSGGAIAGGAFYEATQFPSQYRGSYFFGDYVQGFIKRLTPSNQVLNFGTGLNSPVAVEVGPEGSLHYLSIGAGQVRKVQYIASGNNYPTAVASANPSSGAPPLTVNFSGSASSDPDGDALSYSWNFGDGSPNASGVTVSHTYTTAGPYTATLTVSDGKGGTDTDVVGITVGTRPVGTINTPSSGSMYNAGQTISFSGSATDAEDGTLPASAFEWTVLFHHNTHTHPFQQYSGVRNGSFTIPTVGETDHDVWYRIYLTVRDSSGLTHTVTRDILPNKSTVTLASSTSGLQVLLDGQPRVTPYTFTGVVGISRTLEAPSSQTLNGQIYNFQSWSDGGSRVHNISTPASSATITASYTSGGTAPSRTLVVSSADLSGNPRTGYYTTIYSGDNLIATGYTPMTFTGTQGSTYSVVVHDYGGATFDHWENGSTTRTRTLTLDNNMNVTAFYRTVTGSPPSTYTLTVRSSDMSGNAISGYYTTISSGGTTVQTGYTPLSYVGEAGESYTVTIQDFGGATFDHWENGSTTRTRTLTLDSNLIMTAYFNTSPPPSTDRILTVTSADMSGNPISGYYTTVSSGGSVVQTGFTPLTFTGTQGTTYTVSVSDYGDFVFDHWENSSTTRARTLTLNADTTVTAHYRDTSSVRLTVNSVNMSGNAISGYYTTISSGGTTVQTGYTPLTFTGTLGATYTVSVQDYGDFVFDHWDNGSTTRARTLTLNADTTVTASYRNVAAPVLTVRSADMSGNPISGYYTTVYSGGSAAGTGFTPFTFTGSAGATYTVSIADYGSYVFDHWENGSTTRARTLTLNSNTEVTAHYRSTATRTLSVTSADMSNNPLTGYYTTVSSGGTVVATGFTPFTFAGTTGATYTVTVSDYGSYVFDHWGNGSTTRARTVTLDSDTFLKAFYRNTG